MSQTKRLSISEKKAKKFEYRKTNKLSRSIKGKQESKNKPQLEMAPTINTPPADGKFVPLYAISKAGKKQVWLIAVEKTGTKTPEGHDEALVRVTHGYEGGKMVENEKIISKGKNLGKKNETTPFQQALLESQSTWENKIDTGYAANVTNSHVPGTATKEALAAHETLRPMLAHTFQKRSKDIQYPCFVQAKLDGVRCIFHNDKLTSRNGKSFAFMDHIEKELKPATDAGMILDGELYSTTLSFEQFVGLVKKKKLTTEDKEQIKHVKLWVYDCVTQDSYEKRKELLEAFFEKNKLKNIHLLPTYECKNKEEIKEWHDKFVLEGNEGLIIRNKKGLYKLNTRSADLQKYKEFEDSEYEVTGFTEGEGVEKGLVIWTCKTKDGKSFNVRPRGTHEDRAKLFKEAKKYIGQELTVRYQELTAECIPRFPVGIAFRGYE